MSHEIDNLQPGIPKLVAEKIPNTRFQLGANEFYNGLQFFTGEIVGSLHNINELRFDPDTERELPGWGCSLKLICIGMNLLGKKISLEQVVQRTKSIGIYADAIKTYGKIPPYIVGRIGDYGMDNSMVSAVLKSLYQETVETPISNIKDLARLLKDGYLIITPTIAVETGENQDQRQRMDTHNILVIGYDVKTNCVAAINTDHKTHGNNHDFRGVFNFVTYRYAALEKIAYDATGERNASETAWQPRTEWTKFCVVAFR